LFTVSSKSFIFIYVNLDHDLWAAAWWLEYEKWSRSILDQLSWADDLTFYDHECGEYHWSKHHIAAYSSSLDQSILITTQ